MAVKILFLEDNDSIVMGVEYLLTQEGYQIRIAKRIEEAQHLMRTEEFDLALLDIMLPDGNGFDFCKCIREKSSTPVIFLTAREEEMDVVRGLDLGADDYVVKPFRNRELLSRIRGVLRRNGKSSAKLCCGDIVLDPESCKVFRADREVTLTRLEYRILFSMLSVPGKLFTREEILADIWDVSGNFVNDNTLSVTMKRIREKLGDADGNIIKTVRGMGYRVEK